MPGTSVVRLFQTQVNVIMALAVREMEVQYGKYRIGYAWALFEPAVYIGLLAIMHVYIRGTGAHLHGMTPLMFIICGVLPWFFFSRTMTSLYRVTEASQSLFVLPGVSVLDIIVARALSDFCTYNFIFFLFAIPASIIDHSWPPKNLFDIVVVYNCAWLLGVGLGLAFIPLYTAYPAVENFTSAFLRLGFWTSGLYFVMLDFPSWTWWYLSWNPILSVSELLRSAWFPVYQSPAASPLYIAECICGTLVLGLVCERLFRKRLRHA